MIFVEELARFAEQTRDARLSPIVRRAAAPVRIAVHGRSGVGRGTVETALADAGVSIVERAHPADVHIVVIAEAPKPEDRALLAAADGPAMAVLNKADLSASHAWRASIGVPTVPMVGLLARVTLDAEMMTALRLFVTEPPNLTSTDAFVASTHRVSREVRQRLLVGLDRFGVAHAVRALGTGVAPAAVPALLRRISGVDQVLAQLDATAAPIRYRRVQAALAELRAVAMPPEDRLSGFLGADDTVIAVMAAAVGVIEAAGLVVDPAGDPAAHLRRARRWRHYSRGPVDALHRRCADDISRGSLRLFARARRAADGTG